MSRPLMIVSNRLPIVVRSSEEGKWEVKPGSGGLITALRPVLKQYGGVWIGWPGDTEGAPMEQLLRAVGEEIGCDFHPVNLTPELVEGFYYGFSNETLWPLFHDLLGHARFEPSGWQAYVESNKVFAEVLREQVSPEHIVWVHDYQLILVGSHLRKLQLGNPLVYFLHIPFPSPDIFARLPWRRELIHAFLDYDLVGFQSMRDLRNFSQCVRQFVPEARVTAGRQLTKIHVQGRIVRAHAYPISIDFKDFSDKARAQDVQDSAWYIHEHFPEQQIVLGVDRLDYTKGIPVKFRSFERALEKYPELRNKISLVQIVVPSRQDVPEYARWKENLDRIVGEINGRFADRGWMPVHYMYRAVPLTDLLGYYRASEICLVTPLKDGMNLVCKEFCACSVENNGVMILSEFAGAAYQLRDGALLINPHDREAVADAIYRAYTMPREERSSRMQKLRREIRRNDIFRWVRSILEHVELIDAPAESHAHHH